MSIKFWEVNSEPEVGLDSRMPFGKYSGHLVSELVEHDPAYLMFCYKQKVIWFNESILNLITKPVQYLKMDYEDDVPFWKSTMDYITLFEPKNFLVWFVDEHGFVHVELTE